MARIRFSFSKRGRAAFLPHVELPTLFARAARRAGLMPLLSEGFSPRPRVSLGPSLPMGVLALDEPAEAHFAEWNDELLGRWRTSLPPGIDLLGAFEVEGCSLSKLCEASSYRIALRDAALFEPVCRLLDAGLWETPRWIRTIQEPDGPMKAWFRVALAPADKSIGELVKLLAARELVKDWGDLFFVREGVGALTDDEVVATWKKEGRRIST